MRKEYEAKQQAIKEARDEADRRRIEEKAAKKKAQSDAVDKL